MPGLLEPRGRRGDRASTYEAIPDTTHFLQIERPDECIRAMETFLASTAWALE